MTKEQAELERKVRDDLASKKTLNENEKALLDRLKGRMTTLEIAGQIFYVDFPLETLRPKDDFSTMGISFDDLDDYWNDELGRIEIPYDKEKHHLAEIDDDITEIPEDILVVAFPMPSIMDPVGYSRAHGWSLEETIRETRQRPHFTAMILKGEKNYLEQQVKENRKEKNLPPLKAKRSSKKIGR